MKSRKLFYFAIIGALLATTLFLGNAVTGKFQADAEAIENRRIDLDQFASSLKRLHPDPFIATSEADFDAAVIGLHDEIPNLTGPQFTLEMMRLVALLQDGHTWLLPQQSATGFNILPLRVYQFSDGLFITDADAEYQSMIGGKVVQIGNTNIDAITDALRPLVAHDNEMTILERKSQFYLMPEILHALGFVDDVGQVPWTIQHSDGATETVSVSPISFDDYLDWIQPTTSFSEIFPTSLPQQNDVLYLQNLSANFWMTHLEDADILYFQYNAVTDRTSLQSGTESMRNFSERLSEFLDEHPETPLVIDVRHNLGGNINTYIPLINMLTSHEALQPPGKLFLILGRRTFSAAAVFTDRLRAEANIILVGEPSGAGLNFYSDARPITLSNSRLQIAISSRPFRTVRDDDGPWHEPDIEVNLSSSDFFSGHDSALVAILDLLKSDQ